MKHSIKKHYLLPVAIVAMMGIMMFSCKTSKETIVRTQEILNTDKYTFVAQSVTPVGAIGKSGSTSLSPMYSVKISKDTINAYLPYYGVAHSAPHGGDGAIKFVSTNFEYSKSKNDKNNSWTVVLKINDTKQKHHFTLDIGESGYATLFVRENNRQAISFYGIIE